MRKGSLRYRLDATAAEKGKSTSIVVQVFQPALLYAFLHKNLVTRECFLPQNVAPPPPSNELLLGRAKQHMRFKEWERAVDCLDAILREPKDQPVGVEFVPDKEVRRQPQTF